MGLFDVFRHKQDPLRELSGDDLRRLGRLEAEIERLGLQWEAYKDELKRLVQRLEKREQRAEERALRDREAREPEFTEPPVDPATARVLARRNAMARGNNGVSE